MNLPVISNVLFVVDFNCIYKFINDIIPFIPLRSSSELIDGEANCEEYLLE